MKPDILFFQDQYRWLSNFWEVPIVYECVTYKSVEYAYQASKTLDKGWRENIKRCDTPAQAKRMGKKASLRTDWNDIKLSVMEELVRQKFDKEPYCSILITTGQCHIEESNNWNDTYWGVCNGKGANHLGKIIMKIRKELQEEYMQDGLSY